MVDLDRGQLVVRPGVQRDVDFARDGVVDWKIRRDGGWETERESAAVLHFRKRREFNIERRAEGGFGDLASFGQDDGRGKTEEQNECFFHIEDLLNDVDRQKHNTIKYFLNMKTRFKNTKKI